MVLLSSLVHRLSSFEPSWPKSLSIRATCPELACPVRTELVELSIVEGSNGSVVTFLYALKNRRCKTPPRIIPAPPPESTSISIFRLSPPNPHSPVPRPLRGLTIPGLTLGTLVHFSHFSSLILFCRPPKSALICEICG